MTNGNNTVLNETSTSQGVERKDLQRSNLDKFFKVKQNRKFKGRSKVTSGRNKSGVGGGRRRRFNSKTQEARKLLATRHGISRATKKVNNKFVMRYGEVAKLMRRNGYIFNRTSGKWLTKKDAPKDDKKPTTVAAPTKTNSPIEKDDDVTKKDDATSSTDTTEVLTTGPIKAKGKKADTVLDLFVADKTQNMANDDVESLKSLQARLYLFMQGNETALSFIEKDGEMIPDVSPSDIITYMKSEYGFIWNDQYSVWITPDHEFVFANNTFGEDAKSILARSILAKEGYFTGLDLYEVGKKDLYAKIEELGYVWQEEQSKWAREQTENISRREMPEPVIIKTI
jgi:hypothetical protein